jgi:hypothetical protein
MAALHLWRTIAVHADQLITREDRGVLPIRPRAQFSPPALLGDRLVVAARQPLSDRPANQHGRGYGAVVLIGLVGAVAVQAVLLRQLKLNPPSIEVVDLLDGQKHLLSEVDDGRDRHFGR